jgi:hypothetical protein
MALWVSGIDAYWKPIDFGFETRIKQGFFIGFAIKFVRFLHVSVKLTQAINKSYFL